MLVFGVSAMQGSGGDGHKCHLSFVSSRGVVVVGVNAVCRSFRAGKWWWKIHSPSILHFERGRDIAEEWQWWALMQFVVRFEEGGEWWKIHSPSVSHFEGGRDVAEEWCWSALMAFVVRFEEGESGGGKYTPPPSRVLSEGGKCVAGGCIDSVRCDEEGFTPPLTTLKMAFDVMRRGETLLVTLMCLQRLRATQYNEIIH
jgi:hypothetical protein